MGVKNDVTLNQAPNRFNSTHTLKLNLHREQRRAEPRGTLGAFAAKSGALAVEQTQHEHSNTADTSIQPIPIINTCIRAYTPG